MINFYLRLRYQKYKEKGFTISEMLITTVIIGILAGISVPNMLRWVDNERQNAYMREIISYLELVKKETRRWNGRCTLETIFRLRNDFDPNSRKHIGFQAFNVNCYDMNDSIIKNINNNVPLIEYEVFQQVNMANFTFTPRGHLSVPPVSGKNELVIIIGSRSDSNNVTRGKCIVVSPPIGMISAGHTRNYLSAGSRVMASSGNSTWSKQSCDLS